MKITLISILAVQMVLMNSTILSAQEPPAHHEGTPIKLPPGVTIGTATPEQLAKAVAAAITANPKAALAIVSSVMSQLNSADGAKAAAVMKAVAGVAPAYSLPTLVAAAAKANPALAPDIARAAAAADPKLAIAITKAAAYGAPLESAAIAAAVSKVVPDIPDSTLLAAANAAAEDIAKGLPLSSALNLNPGGNAVNPANTTGGEVSGS